MVQIRLSFYEVKNKQASWFTKVERLCWEEWYINLNVSQLLRTHSSKSHRSKVVVEPGGTVHFLFEWRIYCFTLKSVSLNFLFLSDLWLENALEERSARRAALEASLREVLFQIIKFVNEKKDHVPPIPNQEGVVSYPYEITIPRWFVFSLSYLSEMFLSFRLCFLIYLCSLLSLWNYHPQVIRLFSISAYWVVSFFLYVCASWYITTWLWLDKLYVATWKHKKFFMWNMLVLNNATEIFLTTVALSFCASFLWILIINFS